MNRIENEEEFLVFILVVYFFKTKDNLSLWIFLLPSCPPTPPLSSLQFLLYDFIFSYFGYKQSYLSKILFSGPLFFFF